MSKTTKPKKTKKLKDLATEQVQVIKRGRQFFLPVSGKLLKALKTGQNAKLFWTYADGVLQLSVNAPTMAISILDRPEDRFGIQDD